MTWHVNVGKAVALGVLAICVTVAASLHAIDSSFASYVFTVMLGYVVGNGVGVVTGTGSPPMVSPAPPHAIAQVTRVLHDVGATDAAVVVVPPATTAAPNDDAGSA